MKCSIHFDRSCVEVCRGCGRLICDTCDVRYAGAHYCKACVAVVARPLQRFDPRPLPWALRAINQVSRRWFALLPLAGGLLVTLAALAAMAGTARTCLNQFSYDLYRFGTSNMHYGGLAIPKSTLSVWMQIGAALTLLGVYLIVPRFSMRWLLAGVFAVAAVGAIPFIWISGNPELTDKIHIVRTQPLTHSEFERIQSLLQPQTALKTLPAAMVNELALSPSTCVRNVTVSNTVDSRAILCMVEFSPELTAEQRGTLDAFYVQYAVDLAAGRKFNLAAMPNSRWPSYEALWRAGLTPNNSPDQPAPAATNGF